MTKIESKEFNYNYLYMFKNPIRFFINIHPFKSLLINLNNMTIDDLCQTKPMSFRIRKYYGETDSRTLDFPNLVNFFVLNNKLENGTTYPNIQISLESRMVVNLDTGDFSATQYKQCIERDMLKLVDYEILLKMDIKSFYDTIYTHNLEEKLRLPFKDSYITNQKDGKTAGLIKGPFTSLFLSDSLLKLIVKDFVSMIKKNNITAKVEFFSDDIYVFINKVDVDRVKQLFYEVLAIYDLETNTQKYKEYDYLSYSKENIVDKYWNIIVRDQKNYESSTEKKEYHFNFINQLIYRKSKLNNKKLEAIFINGFFKSTFFVDLDTKKYTFDTTDLHKVLFLYREHPESILYTIHKFAHTENFKKYAKMHLNRMFVNSLNDSFKEEQTYYFYALQFVYGLEFITPELLSKIIQSDNQILISYLIGYELYDNEIDRLLSNEEDHWFLNYHIILRKFIKDNKNVDDLVLNYLIPKPGGNQKNQKRKTYIDFFSNAIDLKLPMINLKPFGTIKKYLQVKKKDIKK